MIVFFAVMTAVVAVLVAAAITYRRSRKMRRLALRNARIQRATVSAVANVQRHYSRAAWIAAQQSVAQAARRNEPRQ